MTIIKSIFSDGQWLNLMIAPLLAVAMLTLTGCSNSQAFTQITPPPAPPVNTTPQIKAPPSVQVRPVAYGEIALPAEELALDLANSLKHEAITGLVAVSTFVDNNDLNKTSAFGRVLADAVSGFISRHGFQVVELRKTANFLMQPQSGEFFLSRNVTHLAKDHDVSAVVVGTYTEAISMVLVSVRLISADDGTVLSSSVLELSKSSNMMYLLGGSMAGSMAYRKAPRRAPNIPMASVDVMERRPKKH